MRRRKKELLGRPIVGGGQNDQEGQLVCASLTADQFMLLSAGQHALYFFDLKNVPLPKTGLLVLHRSFWLGWIEKICSFCGRGCFF